MNNLVFDFYNAYAIFGKNVNINNIQAAFLNLADYNIFSHFIVNKKKEKLDHLMFPTRFNAL